MTSSLPLPLDAAAGVYTADGSGDVSFGGADNPPNPQAVGAPPLLPDGTWNMLSPIFSGVVGDLGIAITGAGLSVQLESVMGVDSNGPDGVGVPDRSSPAPDSSLIHFIIQVP